MQEWERREREAKGGKFDEKLLDSTQLFHETIHLFTLKTNAILMKEIIIIKHLMLPGALFHRFLIVKTNGERSDLNGTFLFPHKTHPWFSFHSSLYCLANSLINPSISCCLTLSPHPHFPPLLPPLPPSHHHLIHLLLPFITSFHFLVLFQVNLIFF